jgi:hypothetical protein
VMFSEIIKWTSTALSLSLSPQIPLLKHHWVDSKFEHVLIQYCLIERLSCCKLIFSKMLVQSFVPKIPFINN